MSDQPETPGKGKLFSYLFHYLPTLIIGVLLLIGFVTMDNRGRSPFMEHGVTMMCLGTCGMVFGAYTAICAEKVAREEQSRRIKMAARFPRLAKLAGKLTPRGSWYSWSFANKVRFLRFGGLFFVVVGILIYLQGWQRL